jgi:hypothetical protein
MAGSVSAVWAAKNTNPTIAPPNAKAYGKSYAEWSAAWWQWALSLPADQNPFFDGAVPLEGEEGDEGGCANIANGQEGPVWFLTGVFNASGQAVRICDVPAGKALFFPLINTECSTIEAPPFYGEDEEALRACVRDIIIEDMFAEIDGVQIADLESYFAESPLFTFSLPENDVLGLGPGEGQSVSSGYFLMLPPLSAGEHVISFGGTYPDFEFTLEILYELTVGPKKP